MTTRTEVFDWLAENCGDLAPITGTDADALMACFSVADLWLRTRSDDVALAFGLCVMRMQTKCQHYAFHAIAIAGDWSHRAELWDAAVAALHDAAGIVAERAFHHEDGRGSAIREWRTFPGAKHGPELQRRRQVAT